MRVLFFLEPVVFGHQPSLMRHHLMWAACVEQAVATMGGDFAVAANPQVCDAWRQSHLPGGPARHCFVLDSFAVLAAFDFKRAHYARALYGAGDRLNPLSSALLAIGSTYRADMVVMTSQNVFVKRAFPTARVLCLEQAPLPRLGQPLRTAFDPLGHQSGSMLQTRAADIAALPISNADCTALRRLTTDILGSVFHADPRATAACDALRRIREEGPVALLVTQPPDWVTSYCTPLDLEFENLLYAWSCQLPAGWLGVPTYHPGYRLSEAMEVALTSTSSRLRFLPGELSQGLSEALLSAADGMVTLSSTTAVTALLMQKRVVVVGTSPFNWWSARNPADLAAMSPLSEAHAHALLTVLTHRYSHRHSTLMSEPRILADLMCAVVRARYPADWFIDTSDWSADRARSLFDLA